MRIGWQWHGATDGARVLRSSADEQMRTRKLRMEQKPLLITTCTCRYPLAMAGIELASKRTKGDIARRRRVSRCRRRSRELRDVTTCPPIRRSPATMHVLVSVHSRDT